MLLSLVWGQLRKHGKFLPFLCCPPLDSLQHSSTDPLISPSSLREILAESFPVTSCSQFQLQTGFSFPDFSLPSPEIIKEKLKLPYEALQQNYIKLLDQNMHKVRNQILYSLKEWCRLFLHCHKALHVETFIQQGMQMTNF